MDIKAYLERIEYAGPIDPGPATLRALHKAHMLAVPFENLDIHLGRPIILEEDRLLAKILDQRRGGFCYELNGAFGALLTGLGFQVTMLSAAVAHHAGGFSPPFDHMALLVQMEERWLADVGFGDSFREPLRLDETGTQSSDGEFYRIARAESHLTLERRADDQTWKPEYRFTLQAYQYADFADMCHYHQTAPESFFSQRCTISKATPRGRVTLSGMRLITTTDSRRDERALNNQEEYAAALEEHFGIKLDVLPVIPE